jgi:hypothetical protein
VARSHHGCAPSGGEPVDASAPVRPVDFWDELLPSHEL